MQHVAVLLTPGGVVDLRDNGFHTTLFLIITEVEAHWIEAVTKIPEMGQEPYRPARTLACIFFHQIPSSTVQRNQGISEVVSPPQVGEIDFPA
jgi:hypothetical protein